MIPCVIGFETDTAVGLLEAAGYCVCRKAYTSRRGIPDADTERVIRQRRLGNNSIEITVSRFRTRLPENEG